jgi:hypothetical protein
MVVSTRVAICTIAFAIGLLDMKLVTALSTLLKKSAMPPPTSEKKS